MKIWVGEHGTLTLGEVHNPIRIETEHGSFGIAQRDGGLEIVRDGEVVWRSRAPDSDDPAYDGRQGRTWTPTHFEGPNVLINVHDPQPASYHVERWNAAELARNISTLRAQRDEAEARERDLREALEP